MGKRIIFRLIVATAGVIIFPADEWGEKIPVDEYEAEMKRRRSDPGNRA